MSCSVTVSNNSGAAQVVAVFLTDSSDGNYSLVFLSRTIGDGSNTCFKWDDDSYGLSWGDTSVPLGAGAAYTPGQSNATEVFPNTASGNNVLPIQYEQGFISGAAYCNSQLSKKLMIVTDTSFTVKTASTMSVALYIQNIPAVAMQGAPNKNYFFDIPQFSYYLTVTEAAQGVALPQQYLYTNARKVMGRARQASISMSTPTQIAFAPGAKDLKYNLNDTLVFSKA